MVQFRNQSISWDSSSNGKSTAKRRFDIVLSLCQGDKTMSLWAPPCKALFLVTMAKRQRNISLRGMGLLSPWVGKETKQHFFEGVGSQAWTKALGLGAYTHAHLKPAKLYSKLKGSANSGAPWGLAVADTPIWLQFLLNESPQVLQILWKSTLGFGGYRHAHLIPVFYNWEPTGSENSR